MSAAVAAIVSGDGLITSKGKAYVRQCAGGAPAKKTGRCKKKKPATTTQNVNVR
jgi:hypothetical protein